MKCYIIYSSAIQFDFVFAAISHFFALSIKAEVDLIILFPLLIWVRVLFFGDLSDVHCISESKLRGIILFFF